MGYSKKWLYGDFTRPILGFIPQNLHSELKRTITRLQDKLVRLATSKIKVNKDRDFVYNFCEATTDHFIKIFT